MAEEEKIRSKAVDLHNELGAAICEQKVSLANIHHILAGFANNTTYRSNGMLPAQTKHALYAYGPSQHTKPSCYT